MLKIFLKCTLYLKTKRHIISYFHMLVPIKEYTSDKEEDSM